MAVLALVNSHLRPDVLNHSIGFGWASDNLWPVVTSLILPAITSEFSPSKPPLLSLSQNIGLLVGAIFWGFGCMLWCILPQLYHGHG